jgi:hypothetical protein
MKVLNPDNTSHSITFIPRYYPTNTLSLEVVKEGYNTTQTIVPTYSIYNGIITLNFDLTGVEQDRFSLKLTEDNKIVFRGKIFFTTQQTQEFKLTKDTYIYA